MAQPQGVPTDFEDHLHLMFDLQVLALRSDLTRVITFMIGKEQSARAYPQIGVNEAHHPLSHHNNQPDIIAHMSKINRYHTELFSQYLGKLRATPDGDGTLLDHMTLVYGAGISNSNAHSGENLPIIVAGGGAGNPRRRIVISNSPAVPPWQTCWSSIDGQAGSRRSIISEAAPVNCRSTRFPGFNARKPTENGT